MKLGLRLLKTGFLLASLKVLEEAITWKRVTRKISRCLDKELSLEKFRNGQQINRKKVLYPSSSFSPVSCGTQW